MSDLISVDEALRLAMERQSRGFTWLDVRSEGEFAEGNLPFSVNTPILCDEHRHMVGTAYKKKGNEAAVELGLRLVATRKDKLIEIWKSQFSSQATPILYCWRGGLRSKFTREWLKDAGFTAFRVQGGYKALRGRLLQELERLPKLLVLSGKTGSRKTKLLRSLPGDRTLDLEGMARHRGSAFGGILKSEQPAQATFENLFYWQLYGKNEPRLIEDESRMVGRSILPPPLYEKMIRSDRIVVEASLEERSSHIIEEYILHPIQSGACTGSELRTHFQDCLDRIKKRTGGMLHQHLSGKLRDAFEEPSSAERHFPWVSALLQDYYDKAYEYALGRKTGKIAFRGRYDECQEWLMKDWPHDE